MGLVAAAVAVVGNLAGCGPSASDTIAFDVAYSYSSWPAKSLGYYITRGGDVYQYDYYDAHPRTEAAPERSEQMTVDDLRVLHGNSPNRIASVSDGEVADFLSAVSDARNEPVATQKVSCKDSGRWTYYGMYDLGDGTYNPVVLGLAGNPAGLNLAERAPGIVRWLQEITRSGLECSMTTGSCDDNACSEKTPICSGASTGSLDSTHCPKVDTCKACLIGSCVVDSSGDKHCSSVPSCDSADPVCGAGMSWCGGNPETGMSCSEPE